MFGSLRKKLEEASAQFNVFDGGQTASTVRAARAKAAPATTRVNTNQPGWSVRKPQSAPLTTQQRVNQSYGPVGFSGFKNYLKDYVDPNTEADRIRRAATTGLNESYDQEQDRLTKQAQASNDKLGVVHQGMKSIPAGVAEFVGKTPGSIAQMQGRVAKTVNDINNPVLRTGAKALTVPFGGLMTDKQADDNIKFGQGLNNRVQNKLQQSAFGDRADDNKWVTGAGKMVGQLGGQVATGGLGTAAIGSQMAADEANKAQATGKSNTYSTLTGLGQGGIGALSEKFGVDRFLPGNNVTGNTVTKLLKRGLTEGAQEVQQQFTQNLIANKAYNPEQGLKDGLAESFVMGGLAGGAMSPMVDIANRPSAPRPTTSLVSKPAPTRVGQPHRGEAAILSDYQEALLGRVDPRVLNQVHRAARGVADRYGIDITSGSVVDINQRINDLIENGVQPAQTVQPTTGLVQRAREAVGGRLTPLNEGGYISLGAPEPKKLPQDIKDQFSKQGSFGREAMDRLEANKISKGDLERAGVVFDPKQVKKIAQTLPEFKANPVMTYRKGDYSYTDAGYGRYPVPEKARSGVFEFKHSRGTMRLNPEALFGKEMAQKLAQTAKDGEQVDFTNTMKASGNRLFTYDQTADKSQTTPRVQQVADPLESLKQEAKPATGARSDYSPENLQANRQIRAKNASSITYADKKTINPDELVTVYRAVPGKAKGGLVEGDWVTPNKEQARLFMKQSWAQDDTGAKIVTKRVKASELRYHADDAKGYVDDELLYVPKQKELLKSSLSQPPKSTPERVQKVADPLESLKQEARTDTSKLATNVLKNEEIVRSVMNGGVFKMRLDNGKVVAFGDKTLLGRLGNDVGSDVTDIIPVSIGRGKSGKASTGQPRLILENQNSLIQLKQALGETTEKKQTFSERLKEKWGEPATQSQPPKSITKTDSYLDTNTSQQVLNKTIQPKSELWSRWFKKSDYTALPEIEQDILKNPQIKDAGTSRMYDYYKEMFGENMTYDEFLNKDIKLYRGGNTSNSAKNRMNSYSLLERKAKRFGDVSSVTVKPKDTYGMLGDFSEGEVFVPAKSQSTPVQKVEPEIPSYVPKDKVDAYLKSDDYLKDQRFKKMADETKSGDPFDHPDMYEKPTPFEQNLQAAGLAPKKSKGLVVSETKPLNGQKIQKVRTAPGKVEQRVVQDRSDEIADTLGIQAKDRVPTTDSQRAERVDTAAQKGLENIKNNPEIVRQAAAPSTLKDKTKRKTFEEATKKYLGGTRSAEIERQATIASLNKEFKLSSKEKINAILSRDNPSTQPMNEKVAKYNAKFKQLTDAAYKNYTDQGVKMGYVSSYLPRIYKNPETGQEVDLPEFKALIQGSKRMKGREAEKVAVDWLVEKDPTKLLERYYKSMDNAVAGRQYMKDLEDNGLVTASTEPVRGMRPVIAEGLQTDGKVFYAQKDVAHKLNELFGSKEATNLVEKTLEKGAGVNSLFQSFVLSGGVPNTPINAFGMMQLLKEGMALHPIKAGRAFFGGGLSKSYANKVFTAKKDIMKLMAENDLDIRVNLEQTGKWGSRRIRDAFKNEGKAAGLNQAWNEFTNDATFGRFMPMLEVLHFENVYKHQLKGNLIRKPKTSAEAARIAAESTKNFYGKTSVYKTSTRSKAVDDAAGALLFAPRFRESMVNFWVKNAKALIPTNYGKTEYRDNQKFMVASAVMYAAMTMLNEAMNGARMDENPDGKKDKLIIPASVAGKFGIDTKGKDIAVPFLPSIATVPRNLASLGANLATGKFNEAGKNAKAFASMPVKTVGDILTNEDYFGNKIVQDDSSPLQKFTQAASYVASSNMQPWIREGLNAKGQNLSKETKKTWGIKEKSTFEALSNAGELPLRFYKPNTYRYGENWTPRGGKDEKFDFKQQRERAALGGEIKNISKTLKLNKRQDELFKSLSSVEFNDDGTLKEDNNPFYKSQRYTALQDDGVFEAMKQKSKLNAKLNGKPIDPIFEDNLAPDQRRVLLWKKTLPPGTSDPTVKKLYEQDWYQDYRNKESAYFDSKKAWNKKMGYKDVTPNTNEYPMASKEVEDAQNAYFALPKGTGDRSSFIRNNPEIWNKMIAFWDSKDAWTNGERSKLGLGDIEDEYASTSGSKGSKRGGRGSKGGSKYDYTKNLFASGSDSASTSKQLRAILERAMSGKS